jgi:CBS domain-containing protein
MTVRDIMSTTVRVCRPDTDLAAVAKLMWDHDCGFIPVVDPAGGIVGVITDRDICMASATRRSIPERISATQAMSGPIHACAPSDSVKSALAVMKRFTVRRLPVVDAGGRLQGVVSLNDIVLAAEREKAASPREILSTLAGICAHRHIEPAMA